MDHRRAEAFRSPFKRVNERMPRNVIKELGRRPWRGDGSDGDNAPERHLSATVFVCTVS